MDAAALHVRIEAHELEGEAGVIEVRHKSTGRARLAGSMDTDDGAPAIECRRSVSAVSLSPAWKA